MEEMEEDDAYGYNKDIVKVLPWLPEIEDDEEGEVPPVKDREIYDRKQQIRLELEKYDYPPLFAKKAWTKDMLEKDTIRYYRPHQNIGANFTPTAQLLRIQELKKDKRKIQPNFFGPDGSFLSSQPVFYV